MKRISSLFYDEKYQGTLIVAIIVTLATIITLTMVFL